MKVSIITVVYNRVDTIADCIDSVLSQDHGNIEYIVIDGDSTDGTKDILFEYKVSIDHFISEPDRGIYDAMNKGLALATGEIIGFMNADDMFNSHDCISEVVKSFSDAEVDIVYGDKVYFDKDLNKQKRFWKSGKMKLSKYKWGWMTPHLSTYIRKSVYEKFGNYRLDLSVSADYELMFRFIYCEKVKVKYLPKVIAKMREGGVSNGSLSKILRTNYQVYKSWQLNHKKVSPFIIILKPLSKLFQLVR